MPSSPTTSPIDRGELVSVSSELGGSDWLVDQRSAALDRFDACALPTDEDEEWRYSRIGELDLGEYGLRLPAAATSDAGGEVPQLSSARVQLVDGSLTSVEGLDDIDGLDIGVLDDAGHGIDLHDDGLDAFDHLNAALCPAPLLISIAAGAVIEQPIQIISLLSAVGVMSAPRVVVDMGENSQATVVEWLISDDRRRLSFPRSVLRLAQAARLNWLGVQDLGSATTSIARQVATVGRDATLSVSHVALGGSSARMRFDTLLDGQGGSTTLNAVYYGDGDQHHDLRTFPSHVAPDTTSLLDFRGALDDAATAVYTGLVHVGTDARGTNAEQSNRIIKLSDAAWAESVPNLEIHNNDVRCAHASAVGPIDADQRFYLESRGVSPADTEKLVVAGFFADLLEDTAIPALAEIVTDRIARRWEISS